MHKHTLLLGHISILQCSNQLSLGWIVLVDSFGSVKGDFRFLIFLTVLMPYSNIVRCFTPSEERGASAEKVRLCEDAFLLVFVGPIISFSR